MRDSRCGSEEGRLDISTGEVEGRCVQVVVAGELSEAASFGRRGKCSVG